MNRLFATLACLTLTAAAAIAQSADGTVPVLRADADLAAQTVTITCGPRNDFPGVLVLLGSFDGTMLSLGKGLPSILANSSVIAMTFTPGETFSITAPWPPVHVLLQAVEVGFKPFGVTASEVLQIGEAPITGAMLKAARQARDGAQPVDRDGNGIIDLDDQR